MSKNNPNNELKKFEYYFIIGDDAKIAKVKYTQIDDGLNSTVRFPQIGEIVVIRGKYYTCKMVTHEYDNEAIGFHLVDAVFSDQDIEGNEHDNG